MSEEVESTSPAAHAVPDEISRQHLAVLLDALDVAIITSTLDGRIGSWNGGAEEMYGYRREEALGRPVTMLAHPEGVAECTRLYERAGLGEQVRNEEVMQRTRSGQEIVTLASVVPLRDTSGAIIGAATVARDITGRKQKERQWLYQAWMLEKVSDAVIITDPDFHIRSWNHAAEQIYGWQADDVLGRRVEEILATNLTGVQREERRRLLAEQGIWTGEVIQHHRDGQAINISASVTLLRDETGRPAGVVAINRDITLRKRLEQEIVRVSEYEQQRIGRDLHDGLASLLSGLAMLSRSLLKRRQQGSAIEVEELEELTTLLGHGAEQTRGLARSLNPVWNDGLADALQEIAATARLLSGIPCHFHRDPDVPNLHGEMANHLFWIAQEAVNNAVKHAGASQITITLGSYDGQTLLCIEDDGVGISSDYTEGDGGMGMHIMQYRAEMIGATLDVMKRAGGGTIVTCLVTPPTPLFPAILPEKAS